MSNRRAKTEKPRRGGGGAGQGRENTNNKTRKAIVGKPKGKQDTGYFKYTLVHRAYELYMFFLISSIGVFTAYLYYKMKTKSFI